MNKEQIQVLINSLLSELQFSIGYHKYNLDNIFSRIEYDNSMSPNDYNLMIAEIGVQYENTFYTKIENLYAENLEKNKACKDDFSRLIPEIRIITESHYFKHKLD